MRCYFVFILFLFNYHFIVQAQTVCHPTPSYPSRFDWENWKCSNSINVLYESPWKSNNIISEIGNDYRYSQGWRLLTFDFGQRLIDYNDNGVTQQLWYFPNIPFPHFLLYNKNRGLIRVFVYGDLEHNSEGADLNYNDVFCFNLVELEEDDIYETFENSTTYYTSTTYYRPKDWMLFEYNCDLDCDFKDIINYKFNFSDSYSPYFYDNNHRYPFQLIYEKNVYETITKSPEDLLFWISIDRERIRSFVNTTNQETSDLKNVSQYVDNINSNDLVNIDQVKNNFNSYFFQFLGPRIEIKYNNEHINSYSFKRDDLKEYNIDDKLTKYPSSVSNEAHQWENTYEYLDFLDKSNILTKTSIFSSTKLNSFYKPGKTDQVDKRIDNIFSPVYNCELGLIKTKNLPTCKAKFYKYRIGEIKEAKSEFGLTEDYYHDVYMQYVTYSIENDFNIDVNENSNSTIEILGYSLTTNISHSYSEKPKGYISTSGDKPNEYINDIFGNELFWDFDDIKAEKFSLIGHGKYLFLADKLVNPFVRALANKNLFLTNAIYPYNGPFILTLNTPYVKELSSLKFRLPRNSNNLHDIKLNVIYNIKFDNNESKIIVKQYPLTVSLHHDSNEEIPYKDEITFDIIKKLTVNGTINEVNAISEIGNEKLYITNNENQIVLENEIISSIGKILITEKTIIKPNTKLFINDGSLQSNSRLSINYKDPSCSQAPYINARKIGLSEYSIDKKLSVYPNPSDGQIQFNIDDEDQILSYTLYNLSGQIVSKSKNIYKHHLDFSEITSGIYIIEIQTLKTNFTDKIILNTNF